MKTASILSLTTAIASSLPNHVGALSKVELRGTASFAEEMANNGRELDMEEKRGLYHNVVVFDECVGMTVTACEEVIKVQIDANPELFGVGHTINTWEVATVRSATAENYYMVGLRTDVNDDNKVVGILGCGSDGISGAGCGMVWYPWDWCVPGETEGAAAVCSSIGPWDCHIGTNLSVEQCCQVILDDEPRADVNGKFLDCYADYPIGSVSNPTDPHRIRIHASVHGIVTKAPVNE